MIMHFCCWVSYFGKDNIILEISEQKQNMFINQYYVYYYVYSNLGLFSYFLSVYCNDMLVTIKKSD